MTYHAAIPPPEVPTLSALPPVTLIEDVIGVTVGTTNGTVAAGNDGRFAGNEKTANKGQVNGYAGLDGSGKVPSAQLPSATVPTVTVIVVDGSTIAGSLSTPYLMQPNSNVVYVKKVSGSPSYITLPLSPTIGVRYDIMDGKLDAASNNISISPPGGMTLENGPTPFVINNNGDSFSFMAVSSTIWRLV